MGSPECCNRHPGGEKKLLGAGSTDLRVVTSLCADGTAKVDPVMTGYYVCDGGCDRVTVGTVYVKELEEVGVKMTYYEVGCTRRSHAGEFSLM